ncbi:MAG: hypothetical protein A2289_07185 [Deltaproteobacteria bacterium RIFOXYA12_FULL_58_15]|nr:MAG: hypothetical protein A2289_07185 [Deltaproteobacteria bacterium RIFOXYA12_FULL_58_15]
MLILGFDWDDINMDKIALHALTTDDVEYLFEHGEPYTFRHPTKIGRWLSLGFVPDDRFILVAFEYDSETQWARVVTAYESDSERYWRFYEKKKNIS